MDVIVEAYKKLPVSTISDALDRLCIQGACIGIYPLAQGSKMAGRAYTVKYMPVTPNNRTKEDYLDDVSPGNVLVLDNNGRLDCTVWEELYTVAARMKGVTGTVIDGACRDVRCSIELDYPIFSRGKCIRTGKERVAATAVNIPVAIGDVQVRPGDIVYGTDDGLLVVPQEKEIEILSIAQMIAGGIENIRQQLLNGISFKAALEKFQSDRL